jgi:hypothetical protein
MSRLPDIKSIQLVIAGNDPQAPATESPEGPASQRVSPMAQSLQLREQAERCRRLARDSTDPSLQNRLLRLADEYAARAGAQENEDENDDKTVWQAGSDDRDD